MGTHHTRVLLMPLTVLLLSDSSLRAMTPPVGAPIAIQSTKQAVCVFRAVFCMKFLALCLISLRQKLSPPVPLYIYLVYVIGAIYLATQL